MIRRFVRWLLSVTVIDAAIITVLVLVLAGIVLLVVA